MRKTLILVLIALLVILCGYTAYSGLNIGAISIAGITEIKALNEELDEKIEEASKLSSVDYQKTISDLNSSYKELLTEKESYNNLVTLSTDEEIQTASKYEKYEIETLWVALGNYATARGVDVKLQVTNSSSGTNGLYDIKFTCVGTYVGITEFIYDIENDSTLGFKIESFKMVPSTDSSASDLQGTFTCKDININLDNSQISESSGITTDSLDTNTSDVIETEETGETEETETVQ